MIRGRRLLAALALVAGLLTLAPTPPAAAAAATRDPVVVVAGTVSPAALLAPFAAQLRVDGFSQVSTFQLADLGLADVTQSAAALRAHVDAVLARTGASRVDIVSHSQGGIVSRYYLRNLGGAAKVDTFVSLSAPNNGAIATNALTTLLGSASPTTVAQMTTGSAFLNALNAGPDVPAPVRAVAFYSWNDLIVSPYATSRHDVGTNVLVQSKCPFSVIGHVGMIYSRTVYTGVRAALLGQSITMNCFALPFPV